MIKYTKKNKGFSLIELMVAMFIGLLLLTGIVTLFTNSNVVNRAQNGLARLQENGRFAIAMIKRDIEMAGHIHCGSLANVGDVITSVTQGYETKPLTVDPNALTFGNGFPQRNDVMLAADPNLQLPDTPMPAGIAYPIDRAYLFRGHECDGSDCQPSVNVTGSDLLTDFRSIGTGDNTRAAFTDILTLRYFNGGARTVNMTTVANSITAMQTAEPLDMDGVGNILVSTCSRNHVVPGSSSGTNVTFSVPLTPAGDYGRDTLVHVFDMEEDLKNVSYFIGVDVDQADPSSGRMVSSLYRSENGNNQLIVEGVERFDVTYLVQLADGGVAEMTADQVETQQGAAICVQPPKFITQNGLTMANGPGCLWRSVYAVRVHMLLNTVVDSSPSDNEPFVYTPDGTAVQDPSGGLVSGLEPGRMHRREFSATVPIRGYVL